MYHQARILYAKGDTDKAKELLKSARERIKSAQLAVDPGGPLGEQCVLSRSSRARSTICCRRIDPTAIPAAAPRRMGGPQAWATQPDDAREAATPARAAEANHAGRQGQDAAPPAPVPAPRGSRSRRRRSEARPGCGRLGAPRTDARMRDPAVRRQSRAASLGEPPERRDERHPFEQGYRLRARGRRRLRARPTRDRPVAPPRLRRLERSRALRASRRRRSPIWRFETTGPVQSEPLYDPGEDVGLLRLERRRALQGGGRRRHAPLAFRRPTPRSRADRCSRTACSTWSTPTTPWSRSSRRPARLRWTQHRTPSVRHGDRRLRGPARHATIAFTSRSPTDTSPLTIHSMAPSAGPSVDLSAEVEQAQGDVPRYLDVDTTPVARHDHRGARGLRGELCGRRLRARRRRPALACGSTIAPPA